jgi:phage-related holin
VIGLPSLLAMLGFVAGAFIFATGPPQDTSPYLSVKTYGPAGALENGAHVIGNVFSFMNTLASWALVAMTILALILTLFGVLLYLTGRGLKVRATWARIVAGLVSVVTLANAAIAFSVLNRAGQIADGLVMAGLLYALWVLVLRFADPPSSAHTTPAG